MSEQLALFGHPARTCAVMPDHTQHIVSGVSHCIACGKEHSAIAPVRTAWVQCEACGFYAMFIYRGKKKS